MSDSYQVFVPTINEHLSKLYKDGEFDLAETIRKFRIVQPEGSRQVECLNDEPPATHSAPMLFKLLDPL
jgi:hypothetical protein